MTTAKEREALRKLLARIEKCSGECGKCPNLAFATGSDGLNAYFALRPRPQFLPDCGQSKADQVRVDRSAQI